MRSELASQNWIRVPELMLMIVLQNDTLTLPLPFDACSSRNHPLITALFFPCSCHTHRRGIMSLQLMLAAPAQAQALTMEQSLCLVKVFLNASIACICFARGLIPPRSPTYQDRRVDDLDLVTARCSTYADFLSFPGELSMNGNSQQFKILLRGRDKRADQILDLLVC